VSSGDGETFHGCKPIDITCLEFVVEAEAQARSINSEEERRHRDWKFEGGRASRGPSVVVCRCEWVSKGRSVGKVAVDSCEEEIEIRAPPQQMQKARVDEDGRNMSKERNIGIRKAQPSINAE